MPVEALTDRRLRGLQHSDGEVIDKRSGISVRADRSGKVTLSLRYRFGKARPRIFLGTYPQLALADARIEAGKIRQAVRHGRDPQADRRSSTAQAEMSFNDIADLFIKRYAQPSKSSWRVDQRMLLFDARPRWGKRSAASITRLDAIKLLFEVAERAPVQANRLRTILAKLFGWGLDSGLIENNPMLGVKAPTRERKGKTRVLNDHELRTLWHAVGRVDALPGIRAGLRMLMLVGQRPGEVMGARVGEFYNLEDAHAAYWEIPAARMKARKAHVIPIVGMARDIALAELSRPRYSEFVFAGKSVTMMGRNSLSLALHRVIDGLDDIEGASLKRDKPTPHDLRRSVISGLARLGVSRDDRMAIAAHSYGDAHSVYDRHDRLSEKRIALESWERHVRKVISGEPVGGAEVITLRRGSNVSP